MKNLKVSNLAPDDFFDSVLESKRNSAQDPDYKARVEGYKPNMRTHFNDYNQRFANGTLVSITPQGYNGQIKDDLLRLYKYESPIFQNLKTEITTSDSGRIENTCQNCTINEVNSLDHFVPKEEVSEFSVHPKNLFPSCTQCNGIKNRFWRNGGQFLFLNLYANPLPDLQYLFPIINFVAGIPEVEFTINNPNGIDPQLFSIIQTHYQRLNLRNRFVLNSNQVITNLEHQISIYKNLLPRQDVIDSIVDYHNKNRAVQGFNHWKSLLSIELTNCQPYMDSLFA